MAVTRKEFARHSRPVLKTARWQVLRHQILERDEWACRCCGTRRGRLEIDHIQPVRTQPELAFNPGNLQVLCASCHTRKTRIECGYKPLDPTRAAWRKAVADMAAEPLTQAKGNEDA